MPLSSPILRSFFANCSSLKSVTLPASIKTIDDKAFWGCERLVHIFSLSENPAHLIGEFQFPESLRAIHVPRAAVRFYKQKWVSYLDFLKGEKDINAISQR